MAFLTAQKFVHGGEPWYKPMNTTDTKLQHRLPFTLTMLQKPAMELKGIMPHVSIHPEK